MPRVPFVLPLLLALALAGCSASPSRTAADGPSPVSRAHSSQKGETRAGDYTDYPAARAMVDRLVRREGFQRDELSRILARLERQQRILDFVNRPSPEPTGKPTGSWTRYRGKFLTEDRVGAGVQFWREHEDALELARLRYGVGPEYVVAIIGVETRYGSNMGRHRVIDALATLAFDFPRRSEFFTGELESYLVMTRTEGLDPFTPVGSYAGAMGLGQFMPSSFQRFAVDFDGDGRRDLWGPADAIGSVAHYFREHGWRMGEDVAVPALARRPEAAQLKADYTTRYPLGELSFRGVTPASPLAGVEEASLLRLDAAGGYEYWLGLPNFYVITRYNHSTYYAMAVHQLAEALRERHDRLFGPVRSARGEGPPGPAM